MWCPPDDLTTTCRVARTLYDQLPSAIVSALLASALTLFGSLSSLMRLKTWKMTGRWHRYGVAFYENNGKRGIHAATVYILPLPPFLFILSLNKSYRYYGSIKSTDMIYIYWRGLGHSERMLAVYEEPLIINRDTVLVGVKSCITRDRKPAANKEIICKSAMPEDQVMALIGDASSRIIVASPGGSRADYE